jgi:V8-like Glu-specific endopeptidase
MGNDPFGTQWCTAEYVGNHRILLTAAHCVMDTKTGNWKSNFKFIQQASRMDGGYWRYAKNETVWSDFYNNGKINWAHDYAFICTTKDSAFGWMGFAANENYNDWTSIGYPGNYGNGLYMYQVDGNNGGITNNVVKMLNNPMGPGSSGGAWIYNPSSDRFANSVNSFEYSGEPNNTYGPYFDMDAWTLYQYAVDHCPGA